MTTVAEPPTQTQSTKRMWHTPTSKAALAWFLFALLYCALFYALYAILFKAPILTGPGSTGFSALASCPTS